MMPLTVKVLRRSLVPVLLGGLLGCSPLNYLGIALPMGNLPLTQIRELTQHNGGAIVFLKGKVLNQAPFLDGGAYQLQDTTGTVWVLTASGLPKQGDEILIKGQIDYQSIPVKELEWGEFYVLELEQLERQPQARSPSQPTQSVKPVKPETDNLFLPHKRYDK